MDDEFYKDDFPTEFEFTKEDLGISDSDLKNDQTVLDVLDKMLFGSYCSTNDIQFERI